MVKVTECIGPGFYSLYGKIKRREYTHYWLKGGRGSLKSSFISIMCILEMINDPKANVLIFRKVGLTLRGSVFEQIVWAINKLGLEEFFDIPKEKLQITYKPTGQKIIFKGFDDATKVKSIKIAKGYFKIVWFEELEEFAGMEEIRKANQSIIRSEFNEYIFFYSYNPPRTRGNWVNVESEINVDNRHVHTSYYYDAPREWLGDEFFIEVDQLKQNNPSAYKHEYLGETIGYGNEVFTNIVVREISDEEYEQFDRIYQGNDFGFSVDQNAFVRFDFNNGRKRLVFLDEIYELQLVNEDLATRILDAEFNDVTTICDSAEPKSIAELRRYGVNVAGAKKGKDSINYGMKFLQGLNEIVIDPRRTPNIYREFTNYEYKRDRHGNVISKYPDRDNHTIDATRYALELFSMGWHWGTSEKPNRRKRYRS